MAKIILVIEDDNFLQGLEVSKFEREGYQILAASNSKEAFKIIDEKKPIDLILLDLLLPDTSGFMILEKIRQDKTMITIPVVVFSNLSDKEDVARANKLGISEFMVKSNYTLSELTNKFKELLGA